MDRHERSRAGFPRALRSGGAPITPYHVKNLCVFDKKGTDPPILSLVERPCCTKHSTSTCHDHFTPQVPQELPPADYRRCSVVEVLELNELQDIDAEVLVSRLQTNLEPLSPAESVDLHLGIVEDEIAESTYRTQESRLSPFVDWCEQNDIENLNELDGRDLHRYRSWRKEQLDSRESLRSNQITLRQLMRSCVKVDAVPPSLPSKVAVPSISGDRSRDDVVESKYAAEVLTHLGTFEYASLDHVIWAIFIETGIRLSTLWGRDVGDFETTPDGTGTLELRHRPESGTRLKNGESSERLIHLSEPTAQVVRDYIDERRLDRTDGYGRHPLLVSEHGRLTKSSIRRIVYAWTRPCLIRNECPAGVPEDEFDECEARTSRNKAYKCPASTSTHSIRRGYLSEELDTGVTASVLADRCDVSPEVIDAFYDKRQSSEKMRLRTELRERAYNQSDNPGYARQ